MPNNKIHTPSHRRSIGIDLLIKVILTLVLSVQLLLMPKIDHFNWLMIKPMIVAGGFCLISLALLFRKDKIPLFLNSFDAIFLAFIALNFLSFFWAINPSLIWGTSFAWLFLFVIYKLFSILPFRNPSYWLKLLLVIIGLNCLSLVVFFVNVSFNKTTIGFSYADLRMIGVFFNVNGNYIASVLVLQFPFLLYIYLKLAKNKWLSVCFFILLAIHAFSIFILNSRGATLAFLLQICFFIPSIYRISRRKYLLIGTLCILFLIVGSLALIQDKATFFKQYNPFKGVQSKLGDDRLTMWEATWEMSKEYPLLGVGSGNWKIGHQEFGLGQYYTHTFDSERFYTHAHNFFFETLGEVGWIGFILFGLLFFYILKYCYEYNKREKDLIGKIPFTLLIGFSVVCCFFGVVYSNSTNLAIPQFIIIAIVFLLQKSDHTKQKHIKLPIASLGFLFVGIFLVSFYSYKLKKGYYKYLILERKGKYEEAIEQLNHIYHPLFYTIENQTILQTRKAQLLIRQDKYGEALLTAEKAVEDAPFFHYSWNILGRVFMKLEDWDNAKICYNNAHELHINYFKTQVQLARLSLREKNYEKANEWVAFYDKNILPFIQEYEVNEVWQKQPRIKKLYKKYKNYEKQVLNIRKKIEANLSSDK